MRLIGLVLALSLTLAPLAVEAQQTAKLYRIGVLAAQADASSPIFDDFRRGLHEFGYVEGQNLVIEWRFAEGKYERFPTLARDLVGLKVDAIVAGITVAVQAAKEATATIPIVMVAVHDPVGSGLVASLARPGSNVTGLSLLTADLVGKQLELLREAFPRAPRVAVLRNPASPPHGLMVTQAETAGRGLGLELRVLQARGPEDFDGAFTTMSRERVGAVLVLIDGMFFLHRARVADYAMRSRMPLMSGAAEYAEAGGLMSYAPSLRGNWRRTAAYIDKLLRGTKPLDLPVEQPTKFELVINLKTAKTLGVTIPQTLLLRADQVIE